MFGVPTFISGDDAVFVRLMHRPAGDFALATSTVERVLNLMERWPELNEFQHTAVLRWIADGVALDRVIVFPATLS